MKKILYSIVSIFALSLVAHAGPYTTILNGIGLNQSNLCNAVVGATGTNSSGLPTNNVTIGLLPGSSTNVYNLNIIGQPGFANVGNYTSQAANTNQYPSIWFSPQAGYPGTLYGPFNNTTFFILDSGTNVSVQIYKLAASLDGVYWQSNAITAAVTTGTPWSTNFASGGWSYYALQSAANTNAPTTSPITNLFEVSGKPGL